MVKVLAIEAMVEGIEVDVNGGKEAGQYELDAIVDAENMKIKARESQGEKRAEIVGQFQSRNFQMAALKIQVRGGITMPPTPLKLPGASHHAAMSEYLSSEPSYVHTRRIHIMVVVGYNSTLHNQLVR